jgi:two-component system alkaline phosphatase synthesis response regulator PhoP
MSRATALVADDSPAIRRILSRALAALGFVVVEATNGNEAVRLARQCHPAIILLDLCMPGMDGWDVVACLRSDPALEEVPIVVVTGYYGDKLTQSAWPAGCQHVIAKPFDPNDIARVIAALTSSIDVCMPRYA